MITAKELREEHLLIERELIELNNIIHSSIINYPNVLHVLKKLKDVWDKHEEKEEPFFRDLHERGFTVPLNKISFEHGKLKRDLDRIMDAVYMGKEDKIHERLYTHGLPLIADLRKHMADEDWILVALPKKFRE